MARDALTRLLAEPVDWRHQAFPATSEPVTIGTVGVIGWNLLAGDLPLPALVLRRSALEHNIARMARWCYEHGVLLAPHGKTTMAPQIFRRQLDAGAWGMTAATASHVRIYREFGVRRVLLANELVEPAALRWLAAELAADPDFDFYCLVDSVDGVASMTDALAEGRLSRPIQVLVELGFEGGRTGCRSLDAAKQVAAAVGESPVLELAGIEGYEGIIGADATDETLRAVDDFLARLPALAVELAASGAFAGRDEVIVSAGGSAFFDRVVEQLVPGPDLGVPVRVVLRCGSYVTHDSTLYERLSPLAGRAADGGRLRPAFELWAAVLSRPEPELAIAGFGKRDVPYDVELPVPEVARSPSGEMRPVSGEMSVTALNDQHAFVRVPQGTPLAVGDLLCCGITHPCTAFDKWALIPIVDDDYTVVEALRTFF